jgi:hypothetical protein
VAREIELLDGHPREGPGRFLHEVRLSCQGEDRPVVVEVGVQIEQRIPAGVGELTQDALIAPFTDIGDALERRRRPGPRRDPRISCASARDQEL